MERKGKQRNGGREATELKGRGKRKKMKGKGKQRNGRIEEADGKERKKEEGEHMEG